MSTVAASFSRSTPGVWVTRSAPRNQVTARVLENAGWQVLTVPVLEIRLRFPEASTVPQSRPDLVVFVSANAVRGLEAALAEPGFPGGERREVPVMAVGRQTAETARGMGWRVETVPVEENAEGLLKALAGIDVKGRRIWIPSGNRSGSATKRLPAALRSRGAEVSAFAVYETLTRVLSRREIEALEKAAPGAIVFHSPSAAEAVFASNVPAVVKQWKNAAPAVSIGPVTSARLRGLGAGTVTECREPTDEAVVRALADLAGAD